MLKPVYKKMNIFWGPNNNRETPENKNGKNTPMVNVKKRYWATQRKNQASKHSPRSPKPHTIVIDRTIAGRGQSRRCHWHEHVFAWFRLQIKDILPDLFLVRWCAPRNILCEMVATDKHLDAVETSCICLCTPQLYSHPKDKGRSYLEILSCSRRACLLWAHQKWEPLCQASQIVDSVRERGYNKRALCNSSGLQQKVFAEVVL